MASVSASPSRSPVTAEQLESDLAIFVRFGVLPEPPQVQAGLGQRSGFPHRIAEQRNSVSAGVTQARIRVRIVAAHRFADDGFRHPGAAGSQGGRLPQAAAVVDRLKQISVLTSRNPPQDMHRLFARRVAQVDQPGTGVVAEL